MTVAGGGGIFVSYRRQETGHLAGRLYDCLADRFGEDQVFMDVDTMELGVDFAQEIMAFGDSSLRSVMTIMAFQPGLGSGTEKMSGSFGS